MDTGAAAGALTVAVAAGFFAAMSRKASARVEGGGGAFGMLDARVVPANGAASHEEQPTSHDSFAPEFTPHYPSFIHDADAVAPLAPDAELESTGWSATGDARSTQTAVAPVERVLPLGEIAAWSTGAGATVGLMTPEMPLAHDLGFPSEALDDEPASPAPLVRAVQRVATELPQGGVGHASPAPPTSPDAEPVAPLEPLSTHPVEAVTTDEIARVAPLPDVLPFSGALTDNAHFNPMDIIRLGTPDEYPDACELVETLRDADSPVDGSAMGFSAADDDALALSAAATDPAPIHGGGDQRDVLDVSRAALDDVVPLSDARPLDHSVTATVAATPEAASPAEADVPVDGGRKIAVVIAPELSPRRSAFVDELDDGIPWLTPLDELKPSDDAAEADGRAEHSVDLAPARDAAANGPGIEWLKLFGSRPRDVGERCKLVQELVMLDDEEIMGGLAQAYIEDPDIRPALYVALEFYRPKTAAAPYRAMLTTGELTMGELAVDRLIAYGAHDAVAPALARADLAPYATHRLAAAIDVRDYFERHAIPRDVRERLLDALEMASSQ